MATSKRYEVRDYFSPSSGEQVFQVWDTLLDGWVYETCHKPAAKDEAKKRNEKDEVRYASAVVA